MVKKQRNLYRFPYLDIFQPSNIKLVLDILKTQIRRFSLANLFIQKLKFLTVRQKFKDCLEPFDVADIMEQYKSGHLEMLARVKVIQHQ